MSVPSVRVMTRLLALTASVPPRTDCSVPQIVDQRQRHRRGTEAVTDRQALERPALDRQIGVRTEAFDVERRAQRVIERDVVAPREGVVGGIARRKCRAPVGIVLELAVGGEIAAEFIAEADPRDIVGRQNRAVGVGDESRKLHWPLRE